MKRILIITLLTLTVSTPTFAANVSNTVYVDVNGLICDFCARALDKVFRREEGVASINVNMDSKVVTIHFNEGQILDDERIKTLIINSGYDVKEIRHEQ